MLGLPALHDGRFVLLLQLERVWHLAQVMGTALIRYWFVVVNNQLCVPKDSWNAEVKSHFASC